MLLTMEYRSQGPPMFVPVVLRSRNARARGSHRAVGPSSDELLRLLSSDLSMAQSQDWGFPPPISDKPCQTKLVVTCRVPRKATLPLRSNHYLRVFNTRR